MKNRAGELWEEWNSVIGDPWKMILVLKTESPSYDKRVHMCLSIYDERITYVEETLTNVWEMHSCVRVYTARYSSYTLQRRRIF